MRITTLILTLFLLNNDCKRIILYTIIMTVITTLLLSWCSWLLTLSYAIRFLWGPQRCPGRSSGRQWVFRILYACRRLKFGFGYAFIKHIYLLRILMERSLPSNGSWSLRMRVYTPSLFSWNPSPRRLFVLVCRLINGSSWWQFLNGRCPT